MSGYPDHYSQALAFSASYFSPPTACLTVSLPKGRRDWFPTFHIVDPVDDLGAPSTPVVPQFRAGG